jgi:hypothetical protein
MKNSPYVGWFRHAPPSSWKSSAVPKSTFFCRAFSSSTRKYIHKVDSDFLVNLDRWHQTLTMILSEDSGSKRQGCHPPLHEIINGRLVGGSGKDCRSKYQYHHRPSSKLITDPASTSAAIKVLARLTSWILFPMVCEEDDVSLCEKTTGLKMIAGATETERTLETYRNLDDDNLSSDDSDSSSVSSGSLGDLTARNPSSLTEIDVETEREFTEMNVSVSEIAEAYYAHQLIDQEQEHRNSNESVTGRQNRSGLLASTYNEDTYVVGQSSVDHRLDYEITQMDIARMARNASRHLDVDSILSLPTVTYQSRSSLQRQREMARRQQQQQLEAKKDADSWTREDGWSFVMVSGIKSSVQGDAACPRRSCLNGDGEEDMCVICLEEFQHGDRLRVLPCDHSFHVGCIDRWLSGTHSHNECFTTGCPTCKKRPSLDELQEQMILPNTDEEAENTEAALDGSVPSWAFAKLGSAMAMSQGF